MEPIESQKPIDIVATFDGGFENVLNFRDVGATINGYLQRKVVREGLLFRSARPDDATLNDRKLLKDEYSIKAVMDLRTNTEHATATKKRNADLKVPALLHSNAALAELPQIPGIEYHEIKITGGEFEKFLLSQLAWLSYLKLIFLYITGFRMQAISILGREVMAPLGLIGLGTTMLDESGPEITKGLRILLETNGLPLLVHCTQGKDRTGIMVVLVLFILGVPLEAIEYDYELTEGKLEREKEIRLAEIREMGLPDDFGSTVPDFVKEVAMHIETKYGGVDKYLDGIGFDQGARSKLQEKLAY